eukprot:gene23701-28718_t
MAELVTLNTERAQLQVKADKLEEEKRELKAVERELKAKEQSIMNLIAKKESPNEDHSLLVIDRNHSLIYEDYTVEKLQEELAKVRGELTYVRGELSKVTDCIVLLYPRVDACTEKLSGGNARSNEVVPSPSASDQSGFTLLGGAELIRKLTGAIESIHLVKNEVKESLKSVSFMLEALVERSQSTGRMKFSASNTDHGQAIYDSLVWTSSIKTSREGAGFAIILPELIETAEGLYNQKPKRPHEKELVNLYTPSLIQIVSEVSPHLRLVNSEDFQWLRCMSGHRKSDMKSALFSAHHPLVQFLPAYENAPVCTVKRQFGKFVSWESRSSIHCIWDAKWLIDMDAFGEMCKYLQIASEDCVDHNGVALKLKGVLFDVHEFWMIRASGSTIVDVVKCKWSQSGSRDCLLHFLRVVDPWLEAVSALCEKLNVTVMDLTDSEQGQSAFLGTGANGRVFKLTSGAVLKVVVGRKSDEVEREYLLMLQYRKRIDVQSLVFPVVEDSFHSGVVGSVAYAGYLLAEEGIKIGPPFSNALKAELAVSLHGLHSHDVIHGDPSINNALTLGGVLKWIDFRQSDFVTTKISRRRDVHILHQSLGGSVAAATEEIEAYVNDPSVERLRQVLLK